MASGFPADFVSGAIAMGFVVIGVFFVKFWRRTSDPLFLIFAGAFWLLAADQVAFTLAGRAVRAEAFIYGFRLAAFVLIIVAIVVKNIGRTRRW